MMLATATLCALCACSIITLNIDCIGIDLQPNVLLSAHTIKPYTKIDLRDNELLNNITWKLNMSRAEAVVVTNTNLQVVYLLGK